MDERFDAEQKCSPDPEATPSVADDACEGLMRKRRMRAAERLFGLQVEDPPDPATLSRELEATYEPGGLH